MKRHYQVNSYTTACNRPLKTYRPRAFGGETTYLERTTTEADVTCQQCKAQLAKRADGLMPRGPA